MNSRIRARLTIHLVVAIFGLLAVAGCASYRLGTVEHPQISSIAIGGFTNLTDEPALEILLRKKLAEHVMRDGSVRLADVADADVVIVGRIPSYHTARAAAAKVRDADELPENRSTYRTQVYRAYVDVEFLVYIPGTPRRLVPKRTEVTGQADFQELPDLDIARQSGLQQALNHAARQVIASVTEAW